MSTRLLVKVRQEKLERNMNHFEKMRFDLETTAVRRIQKYMRLVVLHRWAKMKASKKKKKKKKAAKAK